MYEWNNSERDEFFEAYAACALWSSLDDNDRPMSENHCVYDLSLLGEESMREDCDAFIDANMEFLQEFDPAACGHDFWLTRNHHGAGFWDGGYTECGDALTASAHAFGESYLIVDQMDGMIDVYPC